MKRPAVFFDRDNTLIVGNEYLGDPDKVVLMPGAADAVSRARALGYATVIFSNQSGVARGMFDEPAVRAVNRRVEERLVEANPSAVIDRQEFCPYHPDAVVERYRKESELRKPKPGMILRAAETMALDLPRSWVIGDAPRDIEAGHAAGCRTILFDPPEVERSPAALEETKIKPDFVCASLLEAMDFIARQDTDEPPPKQLQYPPLAIPAAKVEEKTAEKASPKETIPTARLERLCEQILLELRSQREEPSNEFSMTKLFAGITQILAIALLFIAYLERNNDTFFGLIFCAQFVQMLTVALAIMGKSR